MLLNVHMFPQSLFSYIYNWASNTNSKIDFLNYVSLYIAYNFLKSFIEEVFK